MRSHRKSSPKATVVSLIHRDFPLAGDSEDVGAVLERFRVSGLPHKVIYVYVTDGDQRLAGVVPVRRLLAAKLEAKISSIMLKTVVSIPSTATVDEAKEAFSRYQFLAFPVVDPQGRVLGVVDIERFAGDLGDVSARTSFDDVYDLFGLDAQNAGTGSPFRRFRKRFPWLLVTVLGGMLAALISQIFEVTLQRMIGLAFFLPLVLGLNESISMQSATLMIQTLNSPTRDNSPWQKALDELKVTLLLALAAAIVVCGLAHLWLRDLQTSIVIFATLSVTIVLSSFWGVIVPFVMNRLNRRGMHFSAAPLTLALTDVTTLFIYFGIAAKLPRGGL